MSFEKNLKNYFETNYEFGYPKDNSDDTHRNDVVLDKDRKDNIFALAMASCKDVKHIDDIQVNKVISLEKNSPIEDNQKLLHIKSIGKKTKIKRYFPYAVAALFLVAIIPVLIHYQHSAYNNSALITTAIEQDESLRHQALETKSQEQESEALSATRQIIQGEISFPVYEGNVSPSMQAEIKQVNISRSSGMVIHIPEVESVDSEENIH